MERSAKFLHFVSVPDTAGKHPRLCRTAVVSAPVCHSRSVSGEEGDHSWCDLVCAGGCGILLWEPLLEIARQLCAQIESWNRFLSGFLPVYAGVLIMGGETSAGAAASGFF